MLTQRDNCIDIYRKYQRESTGIGSGVDLQGNDSLEERRASRKRNYATKT